MIIQPFLKTSITSGTEKINYKIIKKDNTLAEITFNYVSESGNFNIMNPEYGVENRALKSDKLEYIILNKQNSMFKFNSYYKTGIQPKSVTFINNDQVCVPLLADNTIDVIDINNGNTVKLTVPEKYSGKKGFVEALVLKNKNELWISQMINASAHVFDLTTLKYKTTVETKGTWSKVLAYNPVMNKIFLTNWESHDISVINPDSYLEEYTIPCFGVPRGIVFSNDYKTMYVCQYYAVVGKKQTKGEVLKIDLATNKVVKKFGDPGAKRHMVKIPDKNYLIVSDMGRNSICIYDMITDKLMKEIIVFSHPNTIAVSPDSKYLYVSCRGPNNPESYLKKGFTMGRVYVIEMETFSVKESIEGGNQCTGLDVSPNGMKFVFSDFLDNAIRVYEKTEK